MVWTMVFMGTTTFGNSIEFRSSKAINAFEETPYMFNAFISRNHFQSILSNLIFTEWKPQAYKDHF